MTYDQFWNDDCDLVKLYRKAEEIRRERVNREAWVQGVYFYEAMSRSLPMLFKMVDKRAKGQLPYLEEPFAISVKQVEQKEEQQAKKTFSKGQAFMAKFLIDTNKKWKGSESRADND